MSKDVILDRYARLYEIPRQLARLGHEVHAWCLGYRDEEAEEIEHRAPSGELVWHARALGRRKLVGLARYPRQLLREIRALEPKILVGASDIPHVVLTAWLARRMQLPYVIDLYDNFESFGQARFPGMVSALRSAVRNAALVLTTSEPLRELVVETYRARGRVIAMPSSVDKSVFHPRDRRACRRSFDLPVDAKLVGTAGALTAEKGTKVLYAAWERVRAEHPDVHLVLAGPHRPDLPPPTGDRVHYFGALAHDRVAELLCALDVGVICILDTPFGRYSFPQKAYEMLSCGLAVVAANVGAMNHLLSHAPGSLYRADDAAGLARALLSQLESPRSPGLPIDDWEALLARIEPEFYHAVDGMSRNLAST
jgi:glycosyltransferase involved in cell wall biosynthesis